jgi:acylphosphatase
VIVRVRVCGHVQGVFFRASTRRKALELGLSGWVRNLPDGSVEWVAEGDSHRIDALVAWCRDGGPSGARVDQVDLSEETSELQLPLGFLILR